MSEPAQPRTVGTRAVLLELGEAVAPGALAEAARERWGERLEDAVPGHCTLLLRFVDADTLGRERPALTELASAPPPAAADDVGAEHEIEVVYDGDDLAAVADELDVDADEVVALHTGAVYRVAFLGTAGFPYLLGGDERLALPRRDEPRTRVPAQTVAVAAGYTGLYPREQPGGWHLLGRTEFAVFDATRSPPATLAAGDRVRLRRSG